MRTLGVMSGVLCRLLVTYTSTTSFAHPTRSLNPSRLDVVLFTFRSMLPTPISLSMADAAAPGTFISECCRFCGFFRFITHRASAIMYETPRNGTLSVPFLLAPLRVRLHAFLPYPRYPPPTSTTQGGYHRIRYRLQSEHGHDQGDEHGCT